MYRYEDIREIHLELTSRCNASCPMCPRNDRGGRVIPGLPLAELFLDDIRRMFPEDFIARLARLYMCGTYGDAMVARDTLEVFEHFRRLNHKMSLALHTNGSGRDARWWERLARTVNRCVFGIDGLEDTNHLYRRGTEWRKIMDSVTAYIGAGGTAEWDFLAFKHNEHQIEKARQLSLRLGFKKFMVKRSARFQIYGKLLENHPVLDRKGNEEYRISLPVNELYRNEVLSSLNRLSSYRSYLEETQIVCKAMEYSAIYASPEGLIFPCCWAAKLYDLRCPDGKSEIWNLLHRLPGGKDALNATLRPLRDIIAGPFFQEIIPASWERNSPERQDSKICPRVCGRLDAGQAERLLLPQL